MSGFRSQQQRSDWYRHRRPLKFYAHNPVRSQEQIDADRAAYHEYILSISPQPSPMLPVVFCLLPTYNRFPNYKNLLAEAIESFRRQDYPVTNRILVVCNDCEGQELRLSSSCEFLYDVMNVKERYANLGVKYNAMIQHCLNTYPNTATKKLFMNWEDDDISLPHRITQSVNKLGGYSYWNPQSSWFMESGSGLKKDHLHGVCHNCSVFTEEAWKKVGGYPEVFGDQDAKMDQRLKSLQDTAPPLGIIPKEWNYIYRWGVSNVHFSGSPPYDEFWKKVGKMEVVRGTFEVEPFWELDYSKLCQISSGL